MNGTPLSTTITIEADRAGEKIELVRGQDVLLLARLEPMVRKQSVTLDMSMVERIDAGGIAALIRLYCMAHESGNKFAISDATPHVKEILALVGVERFLASHTADQNSQYGMRLELTAA